jgi:glycosyltransferase involved in cell wall biosynthesis
MIGGYTAPKKRIQELVTMIDEYGLVDRVKWFPLIKYEFMPLVYSLVRKSGGCHLITSLDESFGMTMIESISVGCPVIASNVGALPEVMNKISGELLYDYGDVRQAEAILLKMLDQQAHYGRLFESRMGAVRDEYSIASAAAKYYELIKDSH